MAIITRTGKGSRLTVGEMDANMLRARPYTVYTALVAQSASAAPTATVIENTLGTTPAWQYGSAGTYHLVSAGTFTTNKTFISATAPSASYSLGATRVNADSCSFYWTANTQQNVFVEVRVYD